MNVYKKNLCFLRNYKQVLIPFFQRHYVWNEDNWERLIHEWEYKATHFLGSIIIVSNSSADGQIGEIIDGQQRLTTLSVMYKALYDIKYSKAKNDIEKGELQGDMKKLLKCSTDNSKIVHSCNDKNEYEKILNNDFDCDEIVLDSEIDSVNKELKKKCKKAKIDFIPKEPSQRLLQCYKYFYSYFNSNTDELKKMWTYLNQDSDEANALFAVIEIGKDDEPQKIFDCINSAGVRLSDADIIKNIVFDKARKIISNDNETIKLYNKTWANVFENEDDEREWQREAVTGRIKRTHLEIFLHSYAVIKGIFDPEHYNLEDLADRFKNHLNEITKKEKISSFVEDIKNYALAYKNSILYFDKNDELSNDDLIGKTLLILNELDSKTFYSYFLRIIFDNYDLKKDMVVLSSKAKKELEQLCRFIITVKICKDTSTIKNYNKDLAKLANGKLELKNYIKERINSKKSELNKESFIDGLLNMKEDGLPRLILFLLELKHRENSKYFEGDEKKLRYTYTLEHIMPQKWEEYWSFDIVPQELAQYKDKKTGKYKNCDYGDKNKNEIRKEAIYEIGNMLLLKGKKNSLNSNYIVSKRKKEKNKWKVLQNNCKDFEWNADFISRFNKTAKWNEKSIRKRSEKLIEAITTVLYIK